MRERNQYGRLSPTPLRREHPQFPEPLGTMEKARLQSALALLEAAWRKHDAQCRMQLGLFRDSLDTFKSFLDELPALNQPVASSPVAKRTRPIIVTQLASTNFVLQAIKAVELPAEPTAEAPAAPKAAARITRSRAKQAEAGLPAQEGPPLKKAKARKAKPHDSPAPAVPAPAIPTTPAFELPHATLLQHTPGFRNQCRLKNTDAVHPTPAFGRPVEEEKSSDDDFPTGLDGGDAAASVSPSMHLVQSSKVLERVQSCVRTEKEEAPKRSRRSSFEFLHSASEVRTEEEGTPGLDPRTRSSAGLMEPPQQHHHVHPPGGVTPHAGARDAAMDKENHKPGGFWNNTGKKVYPSARRLAVGARELVLSESRKANRMARPPQDGRNPRKEAHVSPKRTRRQLALGGPADAAAVAAELADLDNITSSITKRTPRLSKTSFVAAARMPMRQEQALILETQNRMARAFDVDDKGLTVVAVARSTPPQQQSASTPKLASPARLQPGVAAASDDDECIILMSGFAATNTSQIDAAALTPHLIIGRGTSTNTTCTLTVDTDLLGSHCTAPASVTQDLNTKPTQLRTAVSATARDRSPAVLGPVSYVISPYKEDTSDEEDEGEGDDHHHRRPQKPIPLWARKENLLPELARLQCVDPDAIFTAEKSCCLTEVFGTKGSKKRPKFARRGSSGDWLQDCGTAAEERDYKVRMGYVD